MNILCAFVNAIQKRCSEDGWEFSIEHNDSGLFVLLSGSRYRTRKDFFIPAEDLSDIAIVDPIFVAQEICKTFSREVAEVNKSIDENPYYLITT